MSNNRFMCETSFTKAFILMVLSNQSVGNTAFFYSAIALGFAFLGMTYWWQEKKAQMEGRKA